MYGIIEELDDIPKEFFSSFPIEREISHLSKEEIEKQYELISVDYMAEEFWNTLGQNEWYQVAFDCIDSTHNDFFSLLDYIYFMNLKYPNKYPIGYQWNIAIGITSQNRNIVPVKDIKPESWISIIVENSLSNITILQYMMSGPKSWKTELVFPEAYLQHEYGSLHNLLIIKKYTRKINMKQHVVKSVKVNLEVGTTFISDVLTMDVISDTEVMVKKDNLQLRKTKDEIAELIGESMIGKKIEEFPKHIRKMLEETLIIQDISFEIDTKSLNIFE